MEKVSIDGLDKAVAEMLLKYSDECYDAVKEVIPEIGKEAAKQVKANANRQFKKGKGGRHYANGWKSQAKMGRLQVECVVYNAYKPQLTHLLENGHANANGTDKVDGRPHIAPVNEWAEKETIKRIEKRLKQG